MKGFILVLVIAASAIASYDQIIENEHEAVLLEVTDLKKKGATEADCKDLAKTSCKEVLAERTNAQKSLDSLKSGKQCVTLGQGGVRKALAHYQRTKRTWYQMKVKVTTASAASVSISAQRFSSLRHGKCGFVFTSRTYLSAKATYDRAVRLEISWKGRVSEAHKMYLRFVSIAKKQVKRCHCRTKAASTTRWSLFTKSATLSRQAKAYAKCKMMQCVLSGTALSSKKCKGTLKPLVKKTLYSVTERTVCRKRPVCGPRCKRNKLRAIVVRKERASKKYKKERASKTAKKKERTAKANKKEQATKKEASSKEKKAKKIKKEEAAKKAKALKAREHRTKAEEKRAKAARREHASKALEKKSKEQKAKRAAAKRAQERKTKSYLRANTNYKWMMSGNSRQAVQYPGGLRAVGGSTYQNWVIKKGISGRNPLHGAAQWHRDRSLIRSGDTVSLYNPTARKVYDCAWGKCTYQPFPPPRGHWGTPYRIYLVNGRKGQPITKGAAVYFDRMWHARWNTNYSLKCSSSYCSG